MIYEKKEFIVKDGLKVTLKTPDIAEAAELLDFIKKICAQTDFLLSCPEDLSDDVKAEEAWLENMRSGKDIFIAAYVDGRIIGDCSVNFDRHIKTRHRCSAGIGIDEAYWNRGIGSLLFDEMIRLAKETEGIEQMELGVLSNNIRGKRLYEKKGFGYMGSIKRANKLKDGTYLDEEMMIKIL